MEDEIASYFLMPIARENKNPLDWWKDNEKDFPSIIIVGKKIFLHSCYLNSIRTVVQYV